MESEQDNPYTKMKAYDAEILDQYRNVAYRTLDKWYSWNIQRSPAHKHNYWVFFAVLEIGFLLHRKEMIICCICSGLESLFSIMLPTIYSHIIDTATKVYSNTGQDEWISFFGYSLDYDHVYIISLCFVSFVGFLIKQYVHLVRYQMSFRTAVDTEDALRCGYLYSFYRSSMLWHSNQIKGKIGEIEKSKAAYEMVHQTISENIIVRGIQMIMVSIALMYHSFYFFSLLLCCGPILFLISSFTWAKIRLISKAGSLKWSECNKCLHDSGSKVETIKIFCTEKQETLRYGSHQNMGHKIEEIQNFLWFLLSFTDSGSSEIIKSILIISCVTSLKLEMITVGDLVLSLTWLSLFTAPLQQLSRHITETQRRIAQLEDLATSIVDKSAYKRQSEGKRKAKELQHSIEFRNVSFSYENKDKAAQSELKTFTTLYDVNVIIPAFKTTAIVGHSGVGKSTLVSMIMRLYDPNSGTILWDGCDLKEFTLKSLRQKVVLISQQTELFDRTILENIAFGDKIANRERAILAARKAYAHEFIMSTPEQYDSRIGMEGIKLSGGQRQRIAIARALYHNPSVLILDESTSNLDAESEMYIQQSIKDLNHAITIIIISHRLSTIIESDHIIVMKQGRVNGVGNHAALFASNKAYAKLYRLQHQEKIDT